MKTLGKTIKRETLAATKNQETDPWNVSVDDLPPDLDREETLWFLLHFAVLAPSPYNTQPWRFRIHRNEVELHADFSRSLPGLDANHRELIISCGAALFQLRVAMEYFGYSSNLIILPEPNHPTLLARAWMGPKCETAGDVVPLFHAIQRRRTNRLPFRPKAVPDELPTEVADAARREGAWWRVVVNEEARSAVADLVAEADRIQWADKQFRYERAQWLRPNRGSCRDGLPANVEGFSDLVSCVGPLIVRMVDLGKRHAARDRGLALSSPVLGLLGTAADSARDWLTGGQALARVLLCAQTGDVQASFLNQAVEVAELRPTLADLFGQAGFPQVLLCLGYGQDVPPTPRRPLKDVVVFSSRVNTG